MGAEGPCVSRPTILSISAADFGQSQPQSRAIAAFEPELA